MVVDISHPPEALEYHHIRSYVYASSKERMAYSSLYVLPLDGSANLVCSKGKMVNSVREGHKISGRSPEGLEDGQ